MEALVKTLKSSVGDVTGAAHDIKSAVPIVKQYGKLTASLQAIIMVFIIAIFIAILVYGERLVKKQSR
jgi:hypothetical protein